MAIEYQLFDSAEAYRPRIPEVAQLFSAVFHRTFPADSWDRWYLSNPYGDPYVALGYHGDQLVGHHALVPQTLVGQGGERLRYLLSVSLMVHPRFRNLSVFMGMVDALHRLAQEEGAPFILAFPNAQTAPLWEKLYGYRPLVQTELCNWMPPDSSAAGSGGMGGPGEMRNKPQCSCPEDSVYWNWRTQTNHARCSSVGKTLQLVYKVIEPTTLMLLDVWVNEEQDAAECLARFAHGLGLTEVRFTSYHAALLGIPDSDLTPHEGYVVRFFGFPLVQEVPDIRFSLLLSDVF
jgi:hypothetical protein